MICPVCKQAEMQEVPETSPLNTTLKCLNCGAQVVKAKTDAADAQWTPRADLNLSSR